MKLIRVGACLALLTAATARKAPKKFESAKEMTLDAPALEAIGDQLFCVAPPDEAPLKLVFASITWDIDFKPDSRGHARAVSDDDFHEAGRSIVGNIPGSRRRRVCSHRTKWTLRCVAVALLHNAFKAPAAQFVVYLVLIALYARTRILKMTGKKTYYREGKTE